MSDTKRIMIGPHDVTEHVAAMYDAIIGSLDWGSQFLDAETQQSILLVGKLAGFEWRDPQMPREVLENDPPLTADILSNRQALDSRDAWRKERLEQWRAQVKAAIDAKALSTISSETCESVATDLLTHVERIGK